MKKSRNFDRISLSTAVESKLLNVKVDQLQLSLKIVTEANNLWSTFLSPGIGYLLQLVGNKTTFVQLDGNVLV